MPNETEVQRHVSDAVSAFATLSNGVWEPKKDPLAIVKLLGAFSGLISLGIIAAQGIGVL